VEGFIWGYTEWLISSDFLSSNPIKIPPFPRFAISALKMRKLVTPETVVY
jgi:hypothetical protein